MSAAARDRIHRHPDFGLTLFAAAPAIVTFLLRRVVSQERYASSFSFMSTLFTIGLALGPIVGVFAVDRVGLPQGIATIFGALYGIVQKRSQSAALA